MTITIENLRRHFGEAHAVNDVSFEVGDGEFVALLGPSGSGKTTLLRMMAGLDYPDSGRILFHGEDVTDVHVRRRKVGFVFQSYALFEHMTVRENVAFGLTVLPWRQRPSKREIQAVVDELLTRVELTDFGDRLPVQLSGGQRQRVALARVLATRPRVLLMDEPFGALDVLVRREVRSWVRKLQRELKMDTILVTHDQDEAFELADRVAVMSQGRLEQYASPEALVSSPATEFVHQFVMRPDASVGVAEGLFFPAPPVRFASS